MEAQRIESYNDLVRAVDKKVLYRNEIQFTNDRGESQQALIQMNMGAHSLSNDTFNKFYNYHPYITTKKPAYLEDYQNYKNSVITQLDNFFKNAISQASANEYAGNFIINTMTNPQTNQVLFYALVSVIFNHDKVIIETRVLPASASGEINKYLRFINAPTPALRNRASTDQFQATKPAIDYSQSEFPQISEQALENLAKSSN